MEPMYVVVVMYEGVVEDVLVFPTQERAMNYKTIEETKYNNSILKGKMGIEIYERQVN